MGLHNKTGELGLPVMTVRAKQALLLFKAVVCFAVSGLFIFYWGKLDVFSGAVPWYRILVPVCIPIIGIVFGLYFIFSSGKQLILLENGVLYHTPFFELQSPYAEIKTVRLDSEEKQGSSAGSYGFSMYRRTASVQTLFLSLSDGRIWGFRTSLYTGLPEAEAELKKRLTAV